MRFSSWLYGPGHSLIVRGICLDDVNNRLWLMYSWVQGLTEPMDGESGVALNVEFDADMIVEDGIAVGAYITDGGASSDGEIGYTRPRRQARYAGFDFSASDDPSGELRIARGDIRSDQGDVSIER